MDAALGGMQPPNVQNPLDAAYQQAQSDLTPSPTTPAGDSRLDPAMQSIIANPPDPTPDDPMGEWDIPMPDIDLVRYLKQADRQRYQRRDSRIVRDITLYRQHQSAVPHGFDKRTDIPFVSPSLSNLVNKMANMLGAPEPRFHVPFQDEPTKQASQAMENFAYWCRRYAKRSYSRSGGGNLQWDEFFYLLLHGTLAARVLPDDQDRKYPFHFSLLDPSTCYPTFAGDKMGLERMIRVYTSTAIDIVRTYSVYDQNLARRMADEMGYPDDKTFAEGAWDEGETVEYWDRRYRAVLWKDIVVMDVVEHNLGYVPFVCVVARGEPKGMNTPLNGATSAIIDEFGNTGYEAGRDVDLAEKGVSVFHHLINTNRLMEITHTLSLIEIEKAIDPPTITYVAPQYQGQEPEPLKTKKKGNNQRILNYQRVEAMPTSPRPTDMAPVLNKLVQDWGEGSLPPVVHGNESGSNVSGFAVESLIAAAKDAILPYTMAHEAYLAQIVEMKLRQYRDVILPLGITVSVPGQTSYGATPMAKLTYDTFQTCPIDVEASLFALAQQNLPGQIQAATMAIQAGLWPIRKGMEHVGSTDPDKDFQDIISEKAIQHPEIMEDFIIPQGFINQGSPQLAQLWMQLVVMPKLQQSMMMGMVPPGANAPGGSPKELGPGGPGGPNHQAGTAPPPPGGPAPGQGRGEAPAQ